MSAYPVSVEETQTSSPRAQSSVSLEAASRQANKDDAEALLGSGSDQASDEYQAITSLPLTNPKTEQDFDSRATTSRVSEIRQQAYLVDPKNDEEEV
jgi:hypothetical protein